MAKVFVGVKIERDLYELLQAFKCKRKFDADSAAVREIIRTYLTEVLPRLERYDSNILIDCDEDCEIKGEMRG